MQPLESIEGVFTTVRVEAGRAVWLKAHLRRLAVYASQARLPSPTVTYEEVQEFVNGHQGLGRLRISHGTTGGRMELEPYVPPLGPLRVGIYPEPVFEAPIKTVPYDHRHKVRKWACAHGYDDAITVSVEGYLLEGAYANLVWVYKGSLYTPDPRLPLLHGLYVQNLHPASMRVRSVPKGAKSYLCNCLQGAVRVGNADELKQTKPRREKNES